MATAKWSKTPYFSPFESNNLKRENWGESKKKGKDGGGEGRGGEGEGALAGKPHDFEKTAHRFPHG